MCYGDKISFEDRLRIDIWGIVLLMDEKMLVEKFIFSLNEISSPWGEIKHACEFFYQRGRTDIIAASSTGKVIAFEAKLTKWRTALQQAYRNKCFADVSYVLLPNHTAQNAIKHLDEFKVRGVGLCCITNDTLEVLYNAPQTEPLQPWLKERALLYIEKGGEYE